MTGTVLVSIEQAYGSHGKLNDSMQLHSPPVRLSIWP